MAVKDRLDSSREIDQGVKQLLEPEEKEKSGGEIAEWMISNFVESFFEQAGYGVEEEALVLDSDLSSIDREQQEAIYEALAERGDTERKEGEIVFTELEGNLEIPASVVWDMGAQEFEDNIPPVNDPRETVELADEVVGRTQEAIDNSEDESLEGVALYRIGHVPGMIDGEFGREIDEKYRQENFEGDEPGFSREDLWKFSKAGKHPEKRYSQHALFHLPEDSEHPGFARVLSTASTQVSGPPELGPYFEKVEDSMERLRQQYEEKGEIEEIPEDVQQAFDGWIRDFYGAGEYIGMNRIMPLFYTDLQSSPGTRENGEITHSMRMTDHYDKSFSDSRGAEKRKWLTNEGFSEVESAEDYEDFIGSFLMEFGPEAELQQLEPVEGDGTLADKYDDREPEEEVTTVVTNGDLGQTYNDILENGGIVGEALIETEEGQETEKVIYEFDELSEEEKKELFELHTTAQWHSMRLRPSKGIIESRDPGTSKRTEDVIYMQEALLNGSHRVQQYLAELGITGMSHQEAVELREGVGTEKEEYEAFELEIGGETVSATVNDIMYGNREKGIETEDYTGAIDVLGESLAELMDEEEMYQEEKGDAYDWVEKMRSYKGPPSDNLIDEEGKILEEGVENARVRSVNASEVEN